MLHPIDDKLASDRPGPRVANLPARRGAFTLMETIIAATITALVATAGTTLVFAVTSGTTQTRGIRSTKATGQYALARIGRAIRESRAIGNLTATSLTLWASDISQDDVVNAGELGFIGYDSTAKQVLYGALDPASGIDPALVIPPSAFVNFGQLLALVPGSARITVVWADGIESLVLKENNLLTEARIVSTKLKIGEDAEEVTYHSTASPRASADYLFVPQAVLPSNGPSGRQRRRFYSRWDGFTDISSAPVWTEPAPVY